MNKFHVSGVTCHLLGVMCHVSGVRCQVSGVRCHMSLTPTATAAGPPFANSPTIHNRLVFEDQKTRDELSHFLSKNCNF